MDNGPLMTMFHSYTFLAAKKERSTLKIKKKKKDNKK